MTADVAAAEENEEERRMRLHQEEMERLLLDQETAGNDDDQAMLLQHQQPLNHENNNNNNLNNNQLQGNNNLAAIALPEGEGGGIDGAGVAAGLTTPGLGGGIRQKLSYTHSSFLAALVTILYALRTRGQWYLALVYLSSSKWAFCVLGNALVALAVQIFTYTTGFFLQGGLRLHEAEGLQDFFRWNVTETCLALTMFRSELSVGTACEFLCLILAKCLHHVAVMRQDHLRMTDDAIQPASWNPNLPTIPWHHVRVLLFLLLLQLLDLCALQYTAQILLTSGPSVSILFAFEAAILLASAWSHLLLWHLHVLDGLLHFTHDLGSQWGRRWLHTWKEHKATLTFAVELQAQAVQFLFYLSFFGFVLTYYGVPINLFREVYISFSALKERMLAFFKYRRLMAGMSRFGNPTEEQLEEAGRVCIICRDEMTIHDCKKLPVCQHVFHKSCLREWLTQQQSCPTCRSDIVAMQAQEASRNAAGAAAAQRQEDPGPAAPVQAANEAQQQEATGSNGTTTPLMNGDGSAQRQSLQSSSSSPSDHMPNNLDNHDTLDVKHPGAKSADSADALFATTRTKTLPSKEKVVRFSESLTGKAPTANWFPALYRVVKGDGASVWHFQDDDNENVAVSDTQSEPFVIRTIPLSVAVLGEREEVKRFPDRQIIFVKIPDGWICEDEILRVYTL
ncbi:hypothetical protein ACA910_000593 [Epithemia clementina (nom. ined.)]